MKILNVVFMSLVFLAISATSVGAHVVVRPAEVETAAFQTFTIGVPNEKDQATVGVRLVLPEGLHHVSPNVKPGWNIEIKKEASEESEGGHGDEIVTELIWTGGSIPEGQRDDFFFSAQAPEDETKLVWKAYQTYQDGTVVEWGLGENEEQPKDGEGSPDFSTKGPASMTSVVNELTAGESEEKSSNDDVNTWVAYGALLLSAIALALSLKGSVSK